MGKTIDHKKRSGRRIAADLLRTSRCSRCKGPATVTRPEKKNGVTKYKGYCTPCLEWRKDRERRAA